MRLINKFSAKKLKELYRHRKMSSPEIAKIYLRDPSSIRNLLRKYKIRIRTMSEAKRGLFKIDIPKKELREVYLEKKLSTPEIGKIYKCSRDTVRYRLKEGGIKTRTKSEARRLLFNINISKKDLKKLYLERKMSPPMIAKIYKCHQKTIRRRLKEYGIKTRTLSEARINFGGVKILKRDLKILYLDKKMIASEIAKKFNCCQRTVLNKLLEHQIPIRTISEANILKLPRYPRKDFSGNLEEKAYLIGFRLGDLTTEEWVKGAPTIYVRASSTKLPFVYLIKCLFSPYGHVWSKRVKGQFNIRCFLNRSFNFLLKKEDSVEPWILKNKKYFASFLAGYTDAEGSFYLLKQGKSSGFSILSQDKNILFQIFSKLNELGVLCRPPYLSRKRGTIHKGIISNKDEWSVSVRRKDSLLKLIKLIGVYLKHSERRKKMTAVRKNILWRNKKYNNCKSHRWDKLYLTEEKKYVRPFTLAPSKI